MSSSLSNRYALRAPTPTTPSAPQAEPPQFVMTGPTGLFSNDLILSIAQRMGSLRAMSRFSRVDKQCNGAIDGFLKAVKTHCRIDVHRASAWIIGPWVKHLESLHLGRVPGWLFNRPRYLGQLLAPALAHVAEGQDEQLDLFRSALRLLGQLPEGVLKADYVADVLEALGPLADDALDQGCVELLAVANSPSTQGALARELSALSTGTQQRFVGGLLRACALVSKGAPQAVDRSLADLALIAQAKQLSPQQCSDAVDRLAGDLQALPTPAATLLCLVLVESLSVEMPLDEAVERALSSALMPMELRLAADHGSKLVGPALAALGSLRIRCAAPDQRASMYASLAAALMTARRSSSIGRMAGSLVALPGAERAGAVHDLYERLASLDGERALIARYQINEAFAHMRVGRADAWSALQNQRPEANQPELIMAMASWLGAVAKRSGFELRPAFLVALYTAAANARPDIRFELFDQLARTVEALTLHGKVDGRAAYLTLMKAARGLTPVAYGIFVLRRIERAFADFREPADDVDHTLKKALAHWAKAADALPGVFENLLDRAAHPGTSGRIRAFVCIGVIEPVDRMKHERVARKRAIEEFAIDLLMHGHGMLEADSTALCKALLGQRGGAGIGVVEAIVWRTGQTASAQTLVDVADALRQASGSSDEPFPWASFDHLGQVASDAGMKPSVAGALQQVLASWLNRANVVPPDRVRQYIELLRYSMAGVTHLLCDQIHKWDRAIPPADGTLERYFYVQVFEQLVRTSGSATGQLKLDMAANLGAFEHLTRRSGRMAQALTGLFDHLLNPPANDALRPPEKAQRKEKMVVLKALMHLARQLVEKQRLSFADYNAMVVRAKTIWNACKANRQLLMPFHALK